MKLSNLIHIQKNSYYAVYFLILLHFVGGPVSNFAIVLTSMWIFYYIIFVRNWDVFFIFLLIVPTIIFSSEIDLSLSRSGNSIFSNFKNVWLLGPFALSSNFTMALAIPIRLFINFNKSRHKILTALYFFCLLLAIAGLVLAILHGEKNPSGLTVGFRIALTIGATLIGQSVVDKSDFREGLDKIVLLSLVLLICGLIRAHWLFVVFGFIPYFLHRIKPKILTLLPLLYAFNILYNLSSSITVLSTIFVSLLFYLLLNLNRLFRAGLSNVNIISLIILIPIFITIYTLSLDSITSYDLTNLKGLAEFKLLGDRKPIWDATWADIWSSSYFVKPAGGQLNVYFNHIGQWKYWTAGSHNIFLEFGRQIGAFSMISFSLIVLYIINQTASNIFIKNDFIIFYCFLSVYLIFGLTGQSLIYDGVGSLFWLLFGQFYQVSYSQNR